MPRFIKETFIVVCRFWWITNVTAKCTSVNDQQNMVSPMLIDLNLDELCYYPFIISMSRCNESCNTAEDPFGRICVPNKIEDVNLKVFNIIKKLNKSKAVAKHVSFECRYEFDVRKRNSRQKWNINVGMNIKNQ